jgi:hypothetical protein
VNGTLEVVTVEGSEKYAEEFVTDMETDRAELVRHWSNHALCSFARHRGDFSHLSIDITQYHVHNISPVLELEMIDTPQGAMPVSDADENDAEARSAHVMVSEDGLPDTNELGKSLD